MKKTVKVGIIGVGGMGSCHAAIILSGKVRRLRLAAVCDIDPVCLEKYDASVARFTDSRQLIRSGLVDAVLIATPHYAHTTIGIDALRNKIHTLVEKPISVHKADAQRLIAAHTDKRIVFAAMFNQRTDPRYIKVRNLILKGKLGQITRINWTITDWFRTQAYYDGGGWRATWAGEGGGVLLNQCPHNLDLLQWVCGMMPVEVRAVCDLGKYHHIEVEDAVTAYLRYANGATGVFVATTGETPGMNRLEICGDLGNVVIDSGKVLWTRNAKSELETIRTCKEPYDRPACTTKEIVCKDRGGQHAAILQNFADVILNGVPLIAPAAEGMASVELANAMLYSSFTQKPVRLPLDANAYERHLKRLIRTSTFTKKATRRDHRVWDISKSFLRNPKT